jgi:hypothetical protein
VKNQVTGGAGKWPMFDRHGKAITVGSKIRYQHCVGSYGQTKISETEVRDSHYPYCQIASAHFDYKSGKLIGYHKHNDFEHGHETWVDVAD